MAKLVQGTDEYEIALSLLSPTNRALVESGEVDMWDGRDGAAVLRYSQTNTLDKKGGALVPGTSLLPNPNHGNVGKLGRKGDYKRTNAYKELVPYLSPATDDPTVYGGLAWLLEQGNKMVEGGDVQYRVNCPNCNWQFWATAFKKGDSKALATMLDHVIGPPVRQVEIEGQIEVLHEALREVEDSRTIEVRVIDDEEIKRRKEALDYDI